MNRNNSIIWGIVLIVIGVLFALNALNITNIDIFFDGWWTLFIIVPCAIGLFTEKDKTGNLIGVGVGVYLLLCCQDILSFSTTWKLLIPAIIVIVGLNMIVKGFNAGKTNNIVIENTQNGDGMRSHSAAFSGCEARYDGEVFNGANLTAAFGGLKCDLRNAVIERDCVIQTTTAFGGIDILVPPYVNVKTNVTCIFGGISNKTVLNQGSPTIYINGNCMFGGVEIK